MMGCARTYRAVLGKIVRRILTPLIRNAASLLLPRERLETLKFERKEECGGLVDLISWSTNDVDVMK